MKSDKSFDHAIDGVIDLFAGAYAKKFEVNASTVDAWSTTLADCDPREIEGAAVAWVRERNDWPPSAPQLLDRIARERERAEKERRVLHETLVEALRLSRQMHDIDGDPAKKEAFLLRHGRGAYLWWTDRAQSARKTLQKWNLSPELARAHDELAAGDRNRLELTRNAIPMLAARSMSIPVSATNDAGGSA